MHTDTSTNTCLEGKQEFVRQREHTARRRTQFSVLCRWRSRVYSRQRSHPKAHSCFLMQTSQTPDQSDAVRVSRDFGEACSDTRRNNSPGEVLFERIVCRVKAKLRSITHRLFGGAGGIPEETFVFVGQHCHREPFPTGVLGRCWPLKYVCIESEPVRLQNFPQCLPRQPTDSWQGPHCGLLSLRAVHPRNPAVGLQPPPDGPQPKVESAGMTPTAADRPQRNAPDPRQKQLPCCVPSSRVQLWATDCVYAGHFSYFSLIRLAPILTKDF
ncbi:hypothetical protein ISCGN_002838 [Ixodes scapularis]